MGVKLRKIVGLKQELVGVLCTLEHRKRLEILNVDPRPALDTLLVDLRGRNTMGSSAQGWGAINGSNSFELEM